MGDHCDRQHTSLSAFIIKQCRQFGLFPNENTTVLSRGDELQVMQYCLAYQNKKNGDKLEADSNMAAMLVDKIRRSAVLSIEQTLLISQSEEKVWSDASQVTVIRDVSREAISLCDDHVIAGSPVRSDATNNHNGGTDKLVEQIQNFQNGVASLRDGQVIEDDIELCKDTGLSSTIESSVLALFHEYKDTNNHWTVMEAYSAFVKVLLDPKSDLHQAITTDQDVYKLENIVGSCCTMQIKVIGCLQDMCSVLCASSSKPQHDVVSSLAQQFSSGTSHHTLLLSPKTPVGKIRAVADSIERSSPREACIAMGTPKTPFSPLSGRGLKEIFVEDLFRSYMHLLVNSRSQLALSRVFNIPERGLDHEAFTHLKHEASSCGLSMYQTLSSFMLRIQLGGQGYAPTKDNPLMMSVKGLGSLLDMIQKLQVIIEEVSELSAACSRVVNVIKNNLIHCKSGKFPSRLVAPVSEKIRDTLSSIIQDMESANKSSPDQEAASNGSRMLGHHCFLVIQHFLDRTALCESQLDLHLMKDIRFSSSTPTRFPCLLTQFRSPSIMDVNDMSDCDDSTISKSLCSVPGSNQHFVSAALYVDNQQSLDLLLTQRTLNSIEVLPSKTIVHPRAVETSCSNTSAKVSYASKEVRKNVKCKGNKRPTTSIEKENLNVSEPNQKMKRRESSSNSIEASQKLEQRKCSQETGSKSKQPGQSCRRRLMPQIKGQGKITGFFRV